MGKPAVAIDLTAEERQELEVSRVAVGRRRGWPVGLGLSCLLRKVWRTKRFVRRWMSIRTQSANGGAAMRNAGLTDFWMSCGRGGRARSAMMRLPKRSV